LLDSYRPSQHLHDIGQIFFALLNTRRKRKTISRLESKHHEMQSIARGGVCKSYSIV